MPTLPSRIMNVRFVPTYPVSLAEGTGIGIATATGTKTIGLDYGSVAASPGIADPATAQIVVYRQATGTYENARLDQLVFPAAGQRTARGDADYTILTTDRVVALTASLTAPRTWTLPAAANVTGGTAIDVIDEAAGIGSTNTLTIIRSASDTINGATTSVLNVARTGARLISDGISKWTINLIGTAQISDAAVTTAKLADTAVTTAKVTDKAITLAKQADVATSVIMGRTTAGTGVQEALTPAQARGVIGSASDTDTGVIEIATAAEMETATDTVRAVVPGRVQNHPGVAKAWAYVTNNGTAALAAGYNIASVSRIAAGRVTVTFTTAFSSANFAAVATSGSSPQLAFSTLSRTTTTVDVYSRNVADLADTDQDFSLTCFGDQ